jgi:hypothetical protein
MDIRRGIEGGVSARAPDVEAHGDPEISFVEALAHPGEVFGDSRAVIEHPWFSDQEKRTVLLSWVRDEFVIEQVACESLPELKPQSRIDAVLDALAELDPLAAGEYRAAVASLRGRTARRLADLEGTGRGAP